MAPPTPDKPAKPGEPTPKPVGDAAQTALQQHAMELRDGAKPADKPKQPLQVDVTQVADRLKLSIKPEDLNIVLKENQLGATRRSLIDQMHNPATDARTLQQTQDKFKAQATDAINVSAALGQGNAGARPIDRINDSMATTERHQSELETALKLNPANHQAYLKTLLGKDASTLSPQEKDYVETLSMMETLRRAKESGSVTNAVYGSAVANGLIGDIAHRDAKGMATPSAAEVADAFTKMGIAQRLNGEAREPGGFKDDYQKIVAAYATQLSDTGKQTLDCIQNASANWHSNAGASENFLLAANRNVDSLNLIQIQQQLEANKNNPEIADKLKNILTVANSARTEYASFLYEHGRLAEAAVKLQQAATETPDQTKADPSFASLVDKVGAKSNGDASTLEGWNTRFNSSMQKLNWADADLSAKHIQDATNQQIAQLDQAKAALVQQQAMLQQKLSTAATQTEKDALTAQLTAAKAQADGFDQQKQAENSSLAFLSYRQGFVHMSEKNLAAAHEDFLNVAKLDPAMAQRLNDNPPAGLPKLDELVKESKEPSWWQQHWRMVAGVTVGVLASAAMAVAVVATGGLALPVVAGIIVAGGGLYAGAGATAGETSLGQVGMNFGIGAGTAAISWLTRGIPLGGAAAPVADVATDTVVTTVAQTGIKVATAEGGQLLATELVQEGGKAIVQEGGKAIVTATGRQVAVTAASETSQGALTATTANLATNAVVTEGTQVAGNAIASDAAGTATGWLGRTWAASLQTGKELATVNTLKNMVTVPSLKVASTRLGVATTVLGFKEGLDMTAGHQTWQDVQGHLLKDALVIGSTVQFAGGLGQSTKAFSFLNTGMESTGVNAWTAGLGYGSAGVPNLMDWYKGNKTADAAIGDTFQQGSINSLTFGLTNHAALKYLTPARLTTTAGALSIPALGLNATRSFLPYAGMEGLGIGVDKYTGASLPLDPTNAASARQTTQNWYSNGFNRVPTTQPLDIPPAAAPDAAAADPVPADPPINFNK